MGSRQSFETIAPHTIEEAYEVADAIGAGDLDGLRDELGDLLFQVVFYAQMAEEAGKGPFRMSWRESPTRWSDATRTSSAMRLSRLPRHKPRRGSSTRRLNGEPPLLRTAETA